MMKMGLPMKDIFEVAKEVGRQLVQSGEMSPETLNIVSRQLVPLEMYVPVANQGFQQALDTLGK